MEKRKLFPRILGVRHFCGAHNEGITEEVILSLWQILFELANVSEQAGDERMAVSLPPKKNLITQNATVLFLLDGFNEIGKSTHALPSDSPRSVLIRSIRPGFALAAG